MTQMARLKKCDSLLVTPMYVYVQRPESVIAGILISKVMSHNIICLWYCTCVQKVLGHVINYIYREIEKALINTYLKIFHFTTLQVLTFQRNQMSAMKNNIDAKKKIVIFK